MIYLDYCATTPVNNEVLDSYNRVTKEYIGNANSMHNLGVKSKELMLKATKQISDIFSCSPKEIIYTSGASESNSSAIKGVAYSFKNRGKHIITSKLEHKSVLDVMNYLEKEGYEISYVKINKDGLVDLNDLERLIRKDTILVSICFVNSETGYRQSLKAIRQVINKKNNNTIFHSDMTQALGKIKIDLKDIDLASFSGHKIYAPKGIGLLYKNEKINIEPLIYGTTDNTPNRGGTPALPLIASLSKAIRLINEQLDENYKYVEKLNNKLLKSLSDYDIKVNSNNNSIPHIINISLKKIKSETFLHALGRHEVFVSTNTACSTGKESTILKELTDDKLISTTSIRISLSYLTTIEEINKFSLIFKEEIDNLLLK